LNSKQGFERWRTKQEPRYQALFGKGQTEYLLIQIQSSLLVLWLTPGNCWALYARRFLSLLASSPLGNLVDMTFIFGLFSGSYPSALCFSLMRYAVSRAMLCLWNYRFIAVEAFSALRNSLSFPSYPLCRSRDCQPYFCSRQLWRNGSDHYCVRFGRLLEGDQLRYEHGQHSPAIGCHIEKKLAEARLRTGRAADQFNLRQLPSKG